MSRYYVIIITEKKKTTLRKNIMFLNLNDSLLKNVIQVIIVLHFVVTAKAFELK